MEGAKKESILLLCYYFPPLGMGGIQRAAKFVKYLPCFAWQPVVITVKDVAYYAYDDSLLQEIKHIPIYRTESLDPLRLLARFKSLKKNSSKTTDNKLSNKILNLLNEVIGGLLFIPDSKILWLPFAIITSSRLIHQKRIKIIFTTSPPHSTHIAGLILKMITSVKWVADFRDDWTGGESQPCPTFFHYFINRVLEKNVLKMADHVIGMCDHLTNSLQKKSGSTKKNFSTIMNGYDRDDFKELINIPVNKKFTITHCGSISRVSNPEPFLAAVRLLFDEHKNIDKDFCIQFFGTDIYGHLKQLLEKYQLLKIVKPIQYLPHRRALEKIMSSHLLLATIFKRTNEEIITGKIFEYFGSGKPVLLISTEGKVAGMVQSLNRGTVVNYNNVIGIKNAIYRYFSLYQKGRFLSYKPLTLTQFDRKYLTGELANILETLINS